MYLTEGPTSVLQSIKLRFQVDKTNMKWIQASFDIVTRETNVNNLATNLLYYQRKKFVDNFMPLLCDFLQNNGSWGLHHGQGKRNEERWRRNENCTRTRHWQHGLVNGANIEIFSNRFWKHWNLSWIDYWHALTMWEGFWNQIWVTRPLSSIINSSWKPS